MLLNRVVRQMNKRIGHVIQVEFSAARTHVTIMVGEPLKAPVNRS